MYICAKGKEIHLQERGKNNMFKEKFGIEIEFTGITRNKASKLVGDYLGGTINEARDYYDTKVITAPDGRK